MARDKYDNLIDIIREMQAESRTEKKKPYKAILTSGPVSLRVEIDAAQQRVSVEDYPGGTCLEFGKRKATTIEGMGRIFLEAADLARL